MNLDSDIVVCGGQEVMSQGHHTIFMRQGTNGHQQLTDSVVHDVLTDAFVGVLMGNTGNVCMHMKQASVNAIFRQLFMSSGAQQIIKIYFYFRKRYEHTIPHLQMYNVPLFLTK